MKIDIFGNAKFVIIETLRGYFKNHVSGDMYFRPKDIKRDIPTMSKYMISKVLKHLKEFEYIEYKTLGGGCDEYGDPCAPWNGYKITILGVEKMLIQFKGNEDFDFN